jgi:hypothetical protein
VWVCNSVLTRRERTHRRAAAGVYVGQPSATPQYSKQARAEGLARPPTMCRMALLGNCQSGLPDPWTWLSGLYSLTRV